jgi:hypothetical protein
MKTKKTTKKKNKKENEVTKYLKNKYKANKGMKIKDLGDGMTEISFR